MAFPVAFILNLTFQISLILSRSQGFLNLTTISFNESTVNNHTQPAAQYIALLYGKQFNTTFQLRCLEVYLQHLITVVLSETASNSARIVGMQDGDLESWNKTDLSEPLQCQEGDDVTATGQVPALEELTGEILSAHSDDHKRMLEVAPVSLFQMRGPYKFLVPVSTDKLNLNTVQLLLGICSGAVG